MSQAETEEPSQSLFYNPDFLAIIGQQPLTHYQLYNKEYFFRRSCMLLGWDRLIGGSLYVGIDG